MAEENGGNEDTRKWRERERTGHLRGRIVAGNQGKGPKPATRRRREQLTAKQIYWRKRRGEGAGQGLVVLDKADRVLVVVAHADCCMPPATSQLPGVVVLAMDDRMVVVLAEDDRMVVVVAEDDRGLSSSPRPTGFYFWKKNLRNIFGIK